MSSRLAITLGAKYAELVGPCLGEVLEGLDRDAGTASFTVTAAFRKTGNGYAVTLKPRLRTPMDPVELDLSEVGGQLALFQSKEEVPPKAIEDAAGPTTLPTTLPVIQQPGNGEVQP